MAMMKAIPAANPDDYVASLSGWQQRYTAALRAAVLDTAALTEVIKWGHLVYFSNGPVLLIRAEERRVLFGYEASSLVSNPEASTKWQHWSSWREHRWNAQRWSRWSRRQWLSMRPTAIPQTSVLSVRPNPSIEGTSTIRLRLLAAAPHVKR